MPKLRVHSFAVSADGYAAGPDQSLENPLGAGGMRLHEWAFASPAFHLGGGAQPADPNADDRALIAGETNIGATIMGRNMFGPVRGRWPDHDGSDDGSDDGRSPGGAWRGWWGEDPPYHHPVFVLTHHPHDPIEMDGGTTFHFTDAPIERVLARAFEAAGGKDVRLGGGVSTVQQYLRAGLVDELNLAIVPTLLGGGERLFEAATPPGYEVTRFETSPTVLHVTVSRAP
jgi:dihydrofolate reductase